MPVTVLHAIGKSFRNVSILMGGLVLLWLSGCGGDEKSAAVGPLPKPKAVPVAKAKTNTAAKSTAQATPAKNNASSKAAATDIPNAHPDDVFRIVQNGEPPADPDDVFSIELPSADDDKFTAVFPEAGADTFWITEYGQTGVPEHPPHPDLELPRDYEVVVSAGFNEDGLPMRIRSLLDDAEMVLVPFGPSVLGSAEGPENARPALALKLNPFYMDVTEVTVGQYRRFLEATKNDDKRLLRVYAVDPDRPDALPMTGIPWGDAAKYCEWLGKTLPTEAQWEKAARGPEGFPHPWGYDTAVWPHHRDPLKITPVKSYPTDRSPYGIYDMAGNAREWCQDWYRPDTYSEFSMQISPLMTWEGPKSPRPESVRVVKGGDSQWNLWAREGVRMPAEDPAIGFRGVLEVKEYPLEPPANNKTAGRR